MMFLLTIEDHVRRSTLERIYDLYKKDLYITALAMVNNHELAEDIVHTTILKANDHLEKVTDTESNATRSYLITITKNLCRDYFREDMVRGKHMKSNIPIDELITVADIDEFVETNVIRDENVKEITELIYQLNPNYADIIKLCFYDQMSISEMASILNISKNNVSIRLKRALIA